MADPVLIAGIVIVASLALLLWFTKTYAVSWEPEHKKKPLKKSMRLQRCDCAADTKCPQGRDPNSGDPYRCKIWVEDTNDI